MEKEQPIRGWPAIHAYYEALPQALERMIEMRVTKLEIDERGGMALACFDFAARAQLRQGKIIDPHGRVSMALRRIADGWRIIHYHESALAASAAHDAASATKPYRAGVPCLNVRDGWRALDFYRKALGVELLMSLERESGDLAHAELRIGEATFMVREEYPTYSPLSPQTVGGASVNLLVHVDNTEAFTTRAVVHGAIVARPVSPPFHGDLPSELVDPFGHSWFFTTRMRAMSPDRPRNEASAAHP